MKTYLADYLVAALAVAAATIHVDLQPRPCEVQGRMAGATTPAQNREAIEATAKVLPVRLSACEVPIDRGIRLDNGTIITGVSKTATVLNNTSAGGTFGDSATLQCLNGRNFLIGYADGITKGKGKNVMLTNPAVAVNYPKGTLCWSWPFAQDGVATEKPIQHRVISQNGPALVLDIEPSPNANALCWTDGAKRPTGATEQTQVLKLYDNVDQSWIGKTILVSDGPQIANETRGEQRIVTNVEGTSIVHLDRPMKTRDFVRTALLACPLNVASDIIIRDMTIGGGPINWSCFIKHCRNIRFERVHFAGVAEFSKCSGLTFVDCSADGGLKLGCCQDVVVQGGSWRRISMEEGCTDVVFDGILLTGIDQLPGVSTDPFSRCERITLRNSVVRDVVDCQFVLEGRECRVENVVVECQPSSAHGYIAGDRVAMLGVRSNRGLVFKAGSGQVAQRLKAPGVQFGWANEPSSNGVAWQIDAPTTTFPGSSWVIR